MKTDNGLLMLMHFKKLGKIYKAVLAVLSLIELVLTLRGLFLFNLERLKLRLYLYSYIFLFTASLATLVFLVICEKNEKHRNKAVHVIYAYAFCFIMWSAFVSCIDCHANGDSGLMVYITASVAVGILTLIRPAVFAVYMGISGTFIAVFTAFARGWTPYSSGFYINFAVFIATAIFINAHNHLLSRREFDSALKLERLSYTDRLTGAFNRRSLDEEAAAKREAGLEYTAVLLDIDGLKEINDTMGHPKGDECLVALAEKLKEVFGERVFRFGGDEFAVISLDTAENVALGIDRVNKSLCGSVDGVQLHISAGIALSSAGEDASSVFAKADKALYESKSAGKSRASIYRP